MQVWECFGYLGDDPIPGRQLRYWCLQCRCLELRVPFEKRGKRISRESMLSAFKKRINGGEKTWLSELLKIRIKKISNNGFFKAGLRWISPVHEQWPKTPLHSCLGRKSGHGLLGPWHARAGRSNFCPARVECH